MYALECAANQTANVEDLQVLATSLVWGDLMPQAAVTSCSHKITKGGIIKRTFSPSTLNILSS